MVVVVLAGAYVTLPVWAPTGYLRRALASQMSRQMGVEVSIEGMSLSWAEGVELRGLTIASPDGFGRGAMAFVRRIRAEFSPVNLLANRRVAWMELDRPELFVSVNEDGQVNIEPLRRLLEFDDKTERTSIKIERASIHQAIARVRLPGHDRLLCLDVADAQMLAGRLQRIGRVTMSAALRQEGDPAPVSLAAGPGGEEVAATVSFTFDNIDLGQLNLPRLLGLPLKSLAGRCSGSLELQVNRQLVADQFTFNTSIRRLGAQPADGPKLPVIDEAWFRVSAAYDPLAPGGGRILLRSFSIRLPGVDLAGHAALAGDIRTASLAGVRSLQLRGAVHPRRLAALLTGRAELPGELAVDGPVLVEAKLAHSGPYVDFDVSADATPAALRRGAGTLKPSGRKLRLEMTGRFDERTGQMTVSGNRVFVGENRFIGLGTVRDIRPLMNPARWAMPATFAEGLQAVPPLQWQGSWEIADLPSLRQLCPGAGDALAGVRLRGPLTGGWVVSRSADGPLAVQIDLTVPSRTHLAVAREGPATSGEWFAKPPGESISVSLAGKLAARPAGVHDLNVALGVAGGSLRIRRGHVRLADGVLAAGAEGVLVNRIESLLACLPAMRSSGLSGRLDAGLAVRLDGDKSLAELTADLSDIDLTWKPVAGPAEKWARRFGGRFGGRLRVTAAHTDASGPADVDVTLDASGMEYVSTGEVCGSKPAGVPFRLALRGRTTQADGRIAAAEITTAALTVGRSRADVSGRAEFDRAKPDVWDGLGLKAFDAAVQIRCVLDVPLKKLLPELADLADRHGLDGEVGATVRVAGGRQHARVTGRVDAGKLTVGRVGPFVRKAPVDATGAEELTLGPFVKPAGIPAAADFELTVPADLAALKLNDLRARLGDVSLLAGGDDIVPAAANMPLSLLPRSGHLAVWTDRARSLHRLVPQLEPLRLAGGAIVEVQWTIGPGGPPNPGEPPSPGGGWGVRYIRGATRSLQGHFRGKDVHLRGEVMLTGLEPHERGGVRLGAATDGLEFRIGDNHGWVIAELADLPDRPKGTLNVLAEALDLKDLADWAAPPTGPGPTSVLSAAEGTTSPARKRPAKLTHQQTEDIRRRAGDLIAALRPLLLSSRISGRLSAESLRYFDAQIGRFYDARNVELACSIDNGHFNADYAAGLYGGCIRTRFNVHLGDAVPIVTQEQVLDDVIATESMQPQLARYFPGNTVYGYFNRDEKVSFALRDLVANTIEARYPLVPAGQARTVTVDGLVIGRAAPMFVTRIFPGLNLAEYRYRRMTGFAQFRPDGTAVNDMIFDGQTYDMYMEGTTDAENVGRYEIGIILLGSPQSAEWNHTYRQGRIPILKFKARIENGKMYDVEVSYPLPTETAYVIFLKNNVFYRIWLAGRKKN